MIKSKLRCSVRVNRIKKAASRALQNRKIKKFKPNSRMRMKIKYWKKIFQKKWSRLRKVDTRE